MEKIFSSSLNVFHFIYYNQLVPDNSSAILNECDDKYTEKNDTGINQAWIRKPV